MFSPLIRLNLFERGNKEVELEVLCEACENPSLYVVLVLWIPTGLLSPDSASVSTILTPASSALQEPICAAVD